MTTLRILKKWPTLLITLILSVGCGELPGNQEKADEDKTDAVNTGTTTTAADLVDVTLSFGSYGGIFLTEATDIDFCFKRLRFKKEESASEEEETAAAAEEQESDDNIDLELGEVRLSGTGTPLGAVSVPQGTYRRIEFDLGNDCNGYSVRVNDGTNVYTTEDSVKIKFKGTFEASAANSQLVLGVTAIINALEAVTSGDAIAPALDAVEENFEDSDSEDESEE